MNKEQIGLRIKLERTKQNLTQEQLAEMADISSSYLSAIDVVNSRSVWIIPTGLQRH